MRTLTLALLLAAFLPGCKSKDDIGTQAAKIEEDTAILRDANGAANQVVRNAGDCDAVKAALPEAAKKLDEAAKLVRTAAGQQTIDTLRKQVRTIAEACP
jgi:hypothetical protein